MTGKTSPFFIPHDPQLAQPHSGPGSGLATQEYPFFEGTVCCALQGNGQFYLLTCSHVMTRGSASNYGGYLQPGSGILPVIEQPVPTPLGTWAFAVFTNTLDVALVSLSPEQLGAIQPAAGFNQYRAVTEQDKISQTAVTMLGFSTGMRNGFIVNYNATASFSYNGQLVQMSQLIAISGVPGNNPQPVSQPGDSGAMIHDGAFALGMVIGSDQQFTYAIPMDAILNFLGMTIY
ncbi:MAG: hypothetical protein FD123_511 [Bacteroidetes bacterium]|nr:MAG: hypothetical protein FD123_511 [Bacteroidota bacterium]